MYWTTQVCFSSPAAWGSFCGHNGRSWANLSQASSGPQTLAPGTLSCDWSRALGNSGHRVPVRPFTAVPTQLRGKRPSDDEPRWGGVTRDSRYLNWKLQDHVDDSFPTASEVEAFGESDSETP